MGSKSTEVGRTGARFAAPSGHGRHPRDDAEGDHPTPDAAPPEPAQPLTGARFGPHSERRRKRDKQIDQFPTDLDYQPDPHSERRRDRDNQTDQFSAVLDYRTIVSPDPPPLITPPDERLPLESEVLIRPYARTGGRTKPSRTLALEALITTSSDLTGIGSRHWSWEHRMIANLCVRPRSVAEVAALLSIPLGVARILVGDMATDGTVVIHGSAGHRPPDLILMQRVLAGLRSL